MRAAASRRYPERRNGGGPVIIAVIGGNYADGNALTHAYEVGRGIAEHGHMLLCGGRGGVMEAACRGAKESGGLTIGILPGNDLSDANPYLDVPIITGIGFARNTIITKTANALIAIGGAFGTLTEIAFAFHDGRPVIGLGTWHATNPHGEPWPLIPAATPEEAVKLAVQHAREHPGAEHA
jgi:uncharacterized protein (TIGR00725 family)